MDFDIAKHTIFCCISGSRAYNLHTETSDTDYKGCAIPPIEYFFGLKNFEQFEQQVNKGHPHDKTLFHLTKWVSLALNSNPTILETLFVEPEDIISCHKLFENNFLANREIFLSKLLHKSYLGFLQSQLHRIKNHYRWITNPIKEQPTRKAFNLPEQTKIDTNAIKVLEDLGYEFDSAVMQTIEREKNYRNALKDWNSFLDWKANRNPARAELETKYKYDTKFALHAVRLGLSCKEILLTGKVIVKRKEDREYLMDFREGRVPYEKFIETVEKLQKECNEALLVTSLPNEPNRNLAHSLCVKSIEKFLKEN